MNSAVRKDVVTSWLAAADPHANRPAVSDSTTTWTHRELRDRVAAWGRFIVAQKDGGEHVAISLPHGAEIIAAWLGTLAAGRACLILDPSQSREQQLEQMKFASARLLVGEELIARLAGDQLAFSMNAALSPESRACLYFTSGSTGKPKAVVWPHKTLACASANLGAMFEFTADDRHALLSPLAIAATAAQVAAVLVAGGQLCLFEARRNSTSALAAWLHERRITTIQTVPSLFRAVAAEFAGQKFWPKLRAVKLGGESVTARDAKLFAGSAPRDAMLINGLGITEAGFNLCWFRWRPGEAMDGVMMPIGKPPPGIELDVDAATGEILARATTFAAGYWRDDEHTAQRYRDVPGRPGWRELRTGDAGRWQADGNLEHAGRLDSLIKIRGQRVDPAEVEAAILSLPEIFDASVIAIENGGAQLVAFVQTNEGAVAKESSLRNELATKLPAHAVPSAFRFVEKIPRLQNGKADRQAMISLAMTEAGSESGGSGDALERTLHSLFSRALPRGKQFGTDDSFFDLGGDSLGAAQLFAAISRVLRVDLPLTELKQNPSVRTLATRIRAGGWNLTDNPVALLTPSPAADAVNLFVWPGAGSDVMALCDLAHALGPSVACYAIQHRGADGRRVYDTSVEAMAGRGVQLIRRIQPRGPFAVCGGSFGGIVALEVSRKLLAAGERVAFTGLLDTYAPGFPAVRKNISPLARLRLVVYRLRPVGLKHDPRFRVLCRGIASHLVRWWARRSVRHSSPCAALLPMPWRFIFLQEACFIAFREYGPQPFGGDVHLFVADTRSSPSFLEHDDFLGWRPWIAGARICREVIPGHHGDILAASHVGVLAAKLRGALTSSCRAGGPGVDAKVAG